METAQRLILGKGDFNKFSDELEKIFKAGGENRKMMDKALSYPMTLATTENGLTPVIMETSASKDKLIDKSQAEIKERKVSIQDANGKESVNLRFAYTEEYYNDPITGERESIEIPYVNFENFEEFIEFTQMLAKTYISCRKYATMLLATKQELIANRIQGTGFEMYEKLTGSAKLYGVTKEMLNAAASEGIFEATQATINDFENRKRIALIDNLYLTYKLTNDYKIFGTVRTLLKDSPIYLNKETANVEAASITPIKVTHKEAPLNDITNSADAYVFDKQGLLKGLV